MAARGDKTAWVLALVAAALGSGIFGRYLLATAEDGLVFLAFFALGAVVLALPLMLGEAAFGQFRRRNIVDAFGPGPWSAAGWAAALACLPLAGFLATIAGWSARLAYDAFQGTFFDDPERHLRLVTQGWDALLLTLAAFAVAFGVSAAGARRGLRGAMTSVAVVGLIAVAALAAYAYFEAGSAGRDAAFAFDGGDISATLVVSALQQALVPAFLGFGLVATLSGQVHDRTLPREAALLTIAWVLVPFALGLALAALGAKHGVGLGEGFGLGGALDLFAAIGGTEGGLLAGTFFGVLLAGSMAALVAVLEVPATVLDQRFGLGATRGNLGSALAAYLIAIPFAFSTTGMFDVELILAAVVAPVGGLLVALHVGWVRPEVLDGFLVGDARHQLDRFLRPVLRFVLPVPLLLLALIGMLQVLVYVGGMDAGSGGLWKLVP